MPLKKMIDVTIKDNPDKGKEDAEEEILETPKYMSLLKLDDDQKKRIYEEIEDEWEIIKEEREDLDVDGQCDMLDAQYYGELEENDDMQFNLHRHSTKVKVDAVRKRIKQAFFKTDPIFSVTPLEGFENEGGIEVCERQQDFLSTKLETIVPFEQEFDKVAHSATLKGNGILKWSHRITTERRRREEIYQGDPQPIMMVGEDGKAQQAQDPETGKPLFRNPGLESFLKAFPYPEEIEGFEAYARKLEKGEKINIVVEYTIVTYNDPYPEYVDLKDFWVRTDTKGNQGLKTTRLKAQRHEWTWWELQEKKKKTYFYDIDDLAYDKDDNGKRSSDRRKDYDKESYEVWECTFYTKIEEDDEEYIKCVFWVSIDKKMLVGSILYPYYAVPNNYIDHNIMNINEGFYQPGLGQFLTDNNIAENALLNFTLEGVWSRNTITPITKEGSAIESQFLERAWTHGVPLTLEDGDEIDFLSKYMGNFDIRGLLQMNQYLKQEDDDVTGVSAYNTGKESAVDPTAPATKTLALLRESGINIEDYIETMLPSFNESAYVVLAIYHQMSEEGRKFKVNPEKLVGGENPFGFITKEEMIARTNIRSMAYAFNFDKLNEKKEDLALLNILRAEPLVAGDPQRVYQLLKQIVKGWSAKWRNNYDMVLPRPEQLQQKMAEIAFMALSQFIQQQQQIAQQTQTPVDVNVQNVLAVVSDQLKQIATPKSKEELKAEEEAKKEQGDG